VSRRPTTKRRASLRRERNRFSRSRSSAVGTVQRGIASLRAAGLPIHAESIEVAEYVQKRAFHTTDAGSRISLRYNGKEVFSDYRQLTPTVEALLGEVIHCDDWHCYYKSEKKQEAPKKRSFRPTFEALANDWIDGKRVARWADAAERRYIKQNRPGESTLQVNKGSGVDIPSNVAALYRQGFTALELDVGKALEAIQTLPDETSQTNKLSQTIKAVGQTFGQEFLPIHASSYKQDDGGRIHAIGPALCSLPSLVRDAALVSSDRSKAVYHVDFVSCETRMALVMAEAREEAKDIDLFARATAQGRDRQTIKDAVNPFLHGLSPWAMTDDQRDALSAFHDELGPEVTSRFVSLIQGLDHRHDLQRAVSGLFLPSLSLSIRSADGGLGIPLHDGWYFAADHRDRACEVAHAFEAESLRLTGTKFPAKLQQIA